MNVSQGTDIYYLQCAIFSFVLCVSLFIEDAAFGGLGNTVLDWMMEL